MNGGDVDEELVNIANDEEVDKARPRAASNAEPFSCHPNQLLTLAQKPSLGSISHVISLDEPFSCLANEPSDQLHISSLPLEILILILQYFNTDELCRFVAPVCKRWYQLAYDPLLWTKVSFRLKNASATSACRILTHSPLLHTLNLNGQSHLAVYVVPNLVLYCPYLRSIDLGFCDSVDSDLLEVLQLGCPKLMTVNVEGCVKINDSCVDVLVKMEKLTSVNMSHCTQLTDESISRLAEGVSWLEYLNIDGIAWVYLSGIRSLSDHCHKSLVSLDLDGANLEDEAVAFICRCWRLERLSVSFAELLTDECLPNLQNLKRLRHLRLRKGACFTSEGLTRLLSSSVPCRTLETLDLTECTMLTDDGVLALAKSCTNLKQLSLEWCWYITDRGVAAIVDHCHSLTHLDLVGIHAITGTSFDRIPTDMPRLQYLDLQNCNEINDELLFDVLRRQTGMTVINYYGEEFTSWPREYSR